VILPAAVRPPLEGLEARPYLEGAHLLVGASLNGGSAYAALRDLFRSAGVERGDLYAAMDGWARAVPKGCDGLVCEAGFWGERGRPDLTGTFRGLSPRTFTPGHLARAILEGMARNLHEIWIRAGSPSGDIVGSGNALRNNPLLREILTECIGADVDLADHREEAAVGAALLAARLIEGAGPFISPQTAFGLQTA
jgi:sedoheptulokinase